MRGRRHCGWLVRWVATTASALALQACQGNISPQPEPPIRGAFDIDFGQVEATVDSYTNHPAGLRGGPGSAKPPGATLRAVNLEDVQDPVETVIQQDGSFEVLFSVAIGDEVRVQILANEQRSEPFDVRVVDDEAPPTRVVHPLACLTISPALELDLVSGAGVLRVENDCAEAVLLDEPALRRPVQGVRAAVMDWPATVAAGGSLSVPLEVDGTAPPELEEIVFLRVLAPENDRRAITLRAGF